MRVRKQVRQWGPIVGLTVMLFGCDGVHQVETAKASAAQITPSEWQALSNRRVLFAHQSVGQNILEGVASLAGQAGVQLPVTKLQESGATNGAGIVHFFVGQNEDPASKLKDFAKTLEEGKAKAADVALVKFCYIDFKENSNAKALAEQYSSTLDRLSQQCPNTHFVAVTAPLTVVQTGPKAWVKRLLGRTPSGLADNLRRREFNDLIRIQYGQSGRLFDLAKIESQDSGSYEYQNRPIETLNPSFTYDDGHLNEYGRKVVATQLVKYLASLPLKN